MPDFRPAAARSICTAPNCTNVARFADLCAACVRSSLHSPVCVPVKSNAANGGSSAADGDRKRRDARGYYWARCEDLFIVQLEALWSRMLQARKGGRATVADQS